MTDPQPPANLAERRAQMITSLHAETSTVPWSDLQRLFASGLVMAVSPDEDLLEVAADVALDQVDAISARIEQGRFGPVSDQQASDWHAAEAHLWACVVKPYVLVQDIPAAAEDTSTDSSAGQRQVH